MLVVTARKRLGDFSLDVDFRMPIPGVVALFGRSGCGKSTTINCIAGLARPDSGRVTLDDEVLLDTARSINVPAERRRIGYVFQDARLFPHLTVDANLRYAERRARGARFVGLDDVTQLLGLQTLLARRTHQLSGGERQRVAIGRALLTQPRLLLLDEPLAALDEARREEVLPYLETLRDQLAIPMVYVTHVYAEVLRLATHIVLLDAGCVVAQGDIGSMSLDRRLRSLIGPDEAGALVNGVVLGTDPATGLTRVRVGSGELCVQVATAHVGAALRVQFLARDLIVSTQPPRHLSVRNSLAGNVSYLQDDDAHTHLVGIDIGGAELIARITKAASRELGLRPGLAVWALVKAVSLRGHAFAAAAADGSTAAGRGAAGCAASPVRQGGSPPGRPPPGGFPDA